jgi:hypothetical protein
MPEWPSEILRVTRELLAAQAMTGLAIALGASWVFVADARLRARRPRLKVAVFGLTLLFATAVGLWTGWQKKWLCDDAFITFAYAQNFARGHGLVFNPGEWVEGYTNFLWALLLGLLGKVGVDIPLAGLFGNLAAFAAVLALSAAIVWKGVGPAARPAIPFAAVALAFSAPLTNWATTGLETMPIAACILAGVYRAAVGGTWSAGLFICAAAMARPDHALFGPAMLVAMSLADWIHRHGVRWRRLLEFCAPFALLFVPWWLIRWKVYGEFFPNTYYAKSGGETYTEQGKVYLTHFLTTTGAWLVLPTFLLAGVRSTRSRTDTLLRIFTAMGTLLLAAYVYRVGGDFMEHRFLLVTLPLLATSLELSFRAREHRLLLPVAAAALAATVLTVKPIGPWEKRWHLAAEESFYNLAEVRPMRIISRNFDMAKALEKTFAPSEVKPRLATGCVGYIGYYSGLPITDVYGLTYPRVAHKPIAKRGRPGHEKRADLADALADNAVFTDEDYRPEWAGATAMTLGGFPMHFLRYDPRVAEAVAKAGGAVPDVDGEIRKRAQSWRRSELEAARAFFEDYLANDPDKARRLAPLVQRLEAPVPELAQLSTLSAGEWVDILRGAEPLFPNGDPRKAALNARVAGRYPFDDAKLPEGVVAVGPAFATPMERSSAPQLVVHGKQGARFLNSYVGGDGALGRLEIDLTGKGESLDVHFLVGGGNDCVRTFAALEVDGVVLGRLCGQNDEVLRPAMLPLRVQRGQKVKLIAVDDATGDWGHLLFDDVILLAPQGAGSVGATPTVLTK